MQIDWDLTERFAPFHHGRVVVRMRDCNSFQSAQRLIEETDSASIAERNPIAGAFVSLNQERPLADSAFWLCSHAEQAGLLPQ